MLRPQTERVCRVKNFEKQKTDLNYLEDLLQQNAKKVRETTKPLLDEVKSLIGIGSL